MSRKPGAESTRPRHATLAVVLQVRSGALQVLLWQRAPRARSRAPGRSRAGSSRPARRSRRRSGATSRRRSTCASCRTSSSSRPTATPGATPSAWSSRRRTSASCQLGLDPDVPDDTRVASRRRPARRRRSTTARSCSRAGSGSAASSPTRTPASRSRRRTFTLAELREVYVAALGHEVSATNLRRVLERRAVIEPTGERRPSGRAGGRPAEVFRFRDRSLAITDPFAALRPRR